MTATIEYLLISVVAFTLISISVAALLNIQELSEYSLEKFKFKSDAISMRNAIEEVCILGNGNSRLVELKGRISVEPGYLYSGRDSVPMDVPCEIEEAEIEGNVIVKNDGKIKFRER